MLEADGKARDLPLACGGPSAEISWNALGDRFASSDCVRPQSASRHAGGFHFSAEISAEINCFLPFRTILFFNSFLLCPSIFPSSWVEPFEKRACLPVGI